MTKKETVLFLCAHNDDQIVGAGGTIAKYSKEGKEIITVIFSYGEKSHPHLKRKVIVKTRVRESQSANRILGGGEILYLGLSEGKFLKEIKEKKVEKKVKSIIRENKPTKIFTHSIDDPHPDHKAVYKFALDLTEDINYNGDVYSFNVWNFFINLRKRNVPKLVVDIEDTFKQKVEAFKRHKSQGIAKLSLMWNVYVQALLNGFNNDLKYAEVFYKIK